MLPFLPLQPAPATVQTAETPLAPEPLGALPADLRPLVRELLRFGFRLQISAPPVRGAYGLFEAGTRRIWIAPISAVHAVQSGPTGKVTPIGWPNRRPSISRVSPMPWPG